MTVRRHADQPHCDPRFAHYPAPSPVPLACRERLRQQPLTHALRSEPSARRGSSPWSARA